MWAVWTWYGSQVDFHAGKETQQSSITLSQAAETGISILIRAVCTNQGAKLHPGPNVFIKDY